MQVLRFAQDDNLLHLVDQTNQHIHHVGSGVAAGQERAGGAEHGVRFVPLEGNVRIAA